MKTDHRKVSALVAVLRLLLSLVFPMFAEEPAVAVASAATVTRSLQASPNPTSVTVAGSMQSEAGCGGDWDPACATTHLTYDANDDVWQGSWPLPTGNYEYKAALNNSWDENYGLHAAPGGANIPLNLPSDKTVKFYY